MADIVDQMVNSWRGLVAFDAADGGRSAIFFRCIHSLMSYQVRGLVQKSLDHLFHYLKQYACGNDIETYDHNNSMFYKQAFMSLRTSIVGKFYRVFENHNDEENPDTILYQHSSDDPDVLPSNLFHDVSL